MDPKEHQPRSGTHDTHAEEHAALREASDILRPLRTFKDDIASVLGKGRTGVVDVVASEEKRREKRRALLEHEKKLQEEIEREGARIRTLTAQIETAKQGGQISRAEMPRGTRAQAPAAVRQQKYTPPPGVLPHMVRAALPASSAEQSQKKVDSSKQLAALRIAEQRLAEAEAELERARQRRAGVTPTALHPEKRGTTRAVKRTIIILGTSAILITAASAISWYVYTHLSTIGTVPPKQSVPTLVPINERVEILRADNTPLSSALLASIRAAGAPPGDLIHFYVTRAT